MIVDTADLLVTPQVAAGRYEAGTTAVLLRILRPGDLAVDLGANQGFHTLTMGVTVGPAGVVHAFEPHPRTFAYLVENVTSVGLPHVVTVHQAAAADREGTAAFRALEGQAAGSHLDIFEDDWTAELPGDLVDVRTVDVAGFLRSLPRRPRLVKVDVEGAELLLLEAMMPVLDPKVTSIVIEIIPPVIEQAGGIGRFLELIRGAGYRIWSVNGEGFDELDDELLRAIDFADVLLAVAPPC